MDRRWLDDTTPADWVLPRLDTARWSSVGGVVPRGYDAYVRILHPVETTGGRMRWGDVAARSNRIAHAGMQLHMIDRPPGTPVPPHHVPDGYAAGSLPRPERDRLIDHLVNATTTPDACWSLVWEGLGFIGDDATTTRVRHPHRDHLLARRSLADGRDSVVPAWDQSPTMWWPEDRAWFVSTEVDFAWTYLGGSQALVDEVLADPRLESFVVHRSDVHTYDSDRLNAALDPSP